MAHRTKLYQQARSPLIQGRSKIERPVWQSSVMGAAVAFGLWFAALAADVAGSLELLAGERISEFMDLVPVPAIALAGAALVGGYLGAGLAMQMGWHRGWRTAAVVAAICDLVALLFVR